MGGTLVCVVYGVGVTAKAPETLECGWRSLMEEYNEKYEKEHNYAHSWGVVTEEKVNGKSGYLIGFCVTSDGFGNAGPPALSPGFPLTTEGFLALPHYKKAAKCATTKWEEFATWAKENGYEFLDKPQLWLTEIEYG